MNLELGQTVYAIRNGKVLEGRISGYEGKFFAEWREWTKSWNHAWGDEKHELTYVYINFPSETATDGTTERYAYFKSSENLMWFLTRKEAEKQIERLEKQRVDMVKSKIQELQNQL